MTDADLLAKKLAEIETYLAQLRRLGSPETMTDDVKEERFVVHTLQLAIQSALDAASHVVADDRLGEAETYSDLFRILAQAGWIDSDLARNLRKMAGFRNLLVHNYGRVDLGEVRRILDERLVDLERFVEAVRRGASLR